MSRLRIDRHLSTEFVTDSLRADAQSGITAAPKTLPPKWFYDEQGSELFEDITRLPEYYPTRAEREILVSRSSEIAALSGATTLVELGSGSSEKTRVLLDAMRTAGRLQRYVPVDVSDTAVLGAADLLLAEYPDLHVHAVVADFEHHLELLPRGGRRIVAFLGGTIGNLLPPERRAFLARLRATLEPGEALLLGTDLVKSPEVLVAAYNDSAGVTAAFNKNVLYVLNRELKADFEPDAFVHVAVWDAENEWIEMRLRSLREQRVSVAELNLEVDFAQGEEMRTEVSAKFRRERVREELSAAGFRLDAWWTDAEGRFALSLATAA